MNVNIKQKTIFLIILGQTSFNTFNCKRKMYQLLLLRRKDLNILNCKLKKLHFLPIIITIITLLCGMHLNILKWKGCNRYFSNYY